MPVNLAALNPVIHLYELEEDVRVDNLIKDLKANLSGDDTREGLCAVLSLKLTNPQFEGQTKTKLGNSEVKGIVDSIVNEKLSAYFEENPSSSKRMILIMWDLRKPIALNIPISRVRSLTPAIMVTKTTIEPTSSTRAEIPSENFRKLCRVSIRPFTIC